MSPERGPVYVAGLERSGTTLLYALLASHPDIAMMRRTNLWTYFFGQFGDLGESANFERCLNAMMRYKRLVVLSLDYDRLRQEFTAGEPTYGRLFMLVGEQWAQRQGRPRWGDKSLHTERYADDIFAAFPHARILHMLRDPRDRHASVETRWKVRRGGVGAGVAEWLLSARLARRNQAQHPDRYRVIRYEELAEQPERTVRMICSFIGEDYLPAILEMGGARSFREQGSNSSYGARPAGVISTESIGRFRQVLSRRQIAFIQAVAGRDMCRFGYRRVDARLPYGERVPFIAADVPVEVAKMLGWRIRHLWRARKGHRLPPHRLVPRPEAA